MMSEPRVCKVQLSVALGASQVTTAEQEPASVPWEMSAGMSAMTGSCPSVTVTLKDIVDWLPWMSVAV